MTGRIAASRDREIPTSHDLVDLDEAVEAGNVASTHDAVPSELRRKLLQGRVLVLGLRRGSGVELGRVAASAHGNRAADRLAVGSSPRVLSGHRGELHAVVIGVLRYRHEYRIIPGVLSELRRAIEIADREGTFSEPPSERSAGVTCHARGAQPGSGVHAVLEEDGERHGSVSVLEDVEHTARVDTGSAGPAF